MVTVPLLDTIEAAFFSELSIDAYLAKDALSTYDVVVM